MNILNMSNYLLLCLLVMFQGKIIADEQQYKIQNGDLIQIVLNDESALKSPFKVDREGRIILPEVGDVHVAGLTISDAYQRISKKLTTVYIDLDNLNIYLLKKQLLIGVRGYVLQPGEFTLVADASIQLAIYAAGGLRAGAQLDKLQLIRDKKTTVFNYKKYLDSGDIRLLPTLQSLDTLFIPASPMIGNVEMQYNPADIVNAGDSENNKTSIKVFAEVNYPGSFIYRESMDIMDLLMGSGGVTRYAGVEKIRVISEGKPILFDLKKHLDSDNKQYLPNIKPGATFMDILANAGGSVRYPGRIEWSDEMSLLDLLAHLGGPTAEADTHNIEIVVPQNNSRNKVYHCNLNAFLSEGQSDQQLPVIKAGSTIIVQQLPQDPSDNKSQWIRQSSEKSIYIFAQVGAPGRYMFTNNMHFLDILAAADGPTDKADLRNIRINHRDEMKKGVSKLDLAMYFETGDEHLLPQVKIGDTIYLPEKNRIWLDSTKENTVRILGATNKPDRYNPTLKNELLREARRMHPLFTWLRHPLIKMINKNRLLTLEV